MSTGGLVGGDSGGSLHVTLVMRGGHMRGGGMKAMTDVELIS